VRQLVQLEQRELRRRRLSKVHHSPNQNVLVRQHDGQPRSQMPGKGHQDRFRRRVASEYLNVNGSARRRLPAQVNVSSVAEVRRPDFVNRARPRQVADLRAKRAVAEKEHRAHMVNRLRRQPVEPVKRAAKEKECRARSLGRSSNEVAHLRVPSAARVRSSQKVEEREHQKKRHRQGRDNFIAITAAAPERETPGPLFT
jgi:hypothetical protein